MVEPGHPALSPFHSPGMAEATVETVAGGWDWDVEEMMVNTYGTYGFRS